ncbi:MAG: PorT family protein [Bacteroidetes bacterium]|jgi:hypothetical protein|nr:PorT family protein [Bacteroidota bacterium]MBT7825995.1 PorT family protein [Bacteroidota bacterium]MBT7994537.1 PorT family protein [Bacteroidota bacterium]
MKFGKILLFVSLFVLGIALSSQAQLFYGFKGGYTGYKLSGDTYGGINSLKSPSGGAILGYKMKIDFSIQGEFLYVNKGVHQLFTHQKTVHSFESDTTPVTILDTKKYDNSLTLSYIEVPILFKKSFSFKGGVFPYDRKTGKLDLDIFLGPYMGYRFGSSNKLTTVWKQDVTIYNNTTAGVEANYDTTSFFIGQDVTITRVDTSFPEALFLNYIPKDKPSISGLSSFDAGITAGIGFSLEISENSKFTIDARYSVGILSIDKTYFNDVEYEFSPSTTGDLTIAGNKFAMVERRTKVDLKNTGMGVYLGYIYFLR